jgi:hypothetical protein
MKTHITLQVPLTKADIFPKSDHFNLPGNVNTNLIQIMCEKRDRFTPEASVFRSENSVRPW